MHNKHRISIFVIFFSLLLLSVASYSHAIGVQLTTTPFVEPTSGGITRGSVISPGICLNGDSDLACDDHNECTQDICHPNISCDHIPYCPYEGAKDPSGKLCSKCVGIRPDITPIPTVSIVRLTPSATPNPLPTLNLTIRKAGTQDSYSDATLTINKNEGADLKWVAQNVTSCSAVWTPLTTITGTTTKSGIQIDKIYNMNCTGPYGSVSDFVLVNVLSPSPSITPILTFTPTPTITVLPTPTLDLKIRRAGSQDQYTDSTIEINQGEAAQLSWNSSNVTSCTAFNGWSGVKTLDGNETTAGLSFNTGFLIHCTGPYGDIDDLVAANVHSLNSTPTYTPAPTYTPTPGVDIKIRKAGTQDPYSDGSVTINQGESVDLYWNSQNVSNCSAFNGWGGNKPTNGAEIASSLNSSATFTIVCYGPYGSVSDAVVAYVNQNNIQTYSNVLISKSARNSTSNESILHDDIVYGKPDDIIEFTLTVRSLGNAVARNVRLNDIFPAGISYVANSTTKDGTVYPNTIAGGTLLMGDMGPGVVATIKFKGAIAKNSFFSSGTTSLVNNASVLADGVGQSSDNVVVLVQKPFTVIDNNKKGPVTIKKLGRNTTQQDRIDKTSVQAGPGDMLEFSITMTTPAEYNNVSLHDILPAGLTYVQGSTRINGVGTKDGIASADGLSLGNIIAGQVLEIRFNTLVNDQFSLPRGTTKLVNMADVLSDTTLISPLAQLPITIVNKQATPPVVKKASAVSTGAETIFVPLFISLMATFTYMFYTKTFLFKKREADALVGKHHQE